MRTAIRHFEITVAGRAHTVEIRRDGLLDRAELRVDGAPVAVTTKRRPFSYLWRYAFAIDGTPVEVRAYMASGAPEMSIAVGDAIAEPVKHTPAGKGAFVAAAIVTAFACTRLVFWSGNIPFLVRLAISGGAFVVVAALGIFVYRRSATPSR